MLRSFALVLFAFAFAPSPVSAQRVFLDPHARGVVYGGGAFAGQSTIEVHGSGGGSLSGSADLDPTALFGLRYEQPIVSCFLLGTNLGVWRYQDQQTDARRTWFDLGVVPTLAFDFDLGKIALEPRLSVPIGASMHLFRSDDQDALDLFGVSRANPGLHVGVLGGLGVYFSHGFGLLLELGYEHHQGFAKGSGDTKWRLSQNQMVLQMGFVLPM